MGTVNTHQGGIDRDVLYVVRDLLCVVSPSGIVCDAAQCMALDWKYGEGSCWVGSLRKTSDLRD